MNQDAVTAAKILVACNLLPTSEGTRWDGVIYKCYAIKIHAAETFSCVLFSVSCEGAIDSRVLLLRSDFSILRGRPDAKGLLTLAAETRLKHSLGESCPNWELPSPGAAQLKKKQEPLTHLLRYGGLHIS